MRITCPNCGAQYEVPVEVIPEEGRDVQCSNCGDTWFQAHPDHEAAETPQELLPDRGAAQEVDDDGPPGAEAQPPEPEHAEAPEETPEAQEELDTGDGGAAPAVQRQPREVDPSVAQILREEADREVRRRQAQAGGLESQEELGLESAPGDETRSRERETRDRMARMRGEQPVEEAEDGTRPRNRSRLLPDIEEINTTLQSGDKDSEVPEPPVPAPRPARRGGFTRGFGVVLIIAIVLVVVYVNAAKISAAMPMVNDAVNAYVLAVDNLRIWLDSKLSGFIPK